MTITVEGETLELNFQDFIIDSGRIGGVKQLEAVADHFKTSGVVHVIMAKFGELTHWWIFRNKKAYVGNQKSFDEMVQAWEDECKKGRVIDL